MNRWLKGTIRALLGMAILLPAAVATPVAAQSHTVNLYFVALGDNGQSGMLIGCNDSLVPVQVQIDAAPTATAQIRAALEQLFTVDEQYYGQSGLYNALYQSDLSVQDVAVSGGHATVRLSGSMQLGGVCDEPRFEQQIRQTILQFDGVEAATLLLNGDVVFGTPTPDRRYFPETGHTVSGRFLTVWEETGGLSVYGYPLTDRLQENGRTVQYFERYRFELHPENVMPYDVLFGRLGYEAAQRRDLLHTAPFQPVQAGDTQHCDYFPETRHRLCFGFRAHWQSHGREFGDSGITQRESLLLYGYPISEEIVDPQTGLTTQYFERAVYQWQPNNPPPWDVLLQRLGAEALRR